MLMAASQKMNENKKRKLDGEDDKESLRTTYKNQNIVILDAYRFLELQHKTLLYVEQNITTCRQNLEQETSKPEDQRSKSLINLSKTLIHQMKEHAYGVKKNFENCFDTAYFRSTYWSEIDQCNDLLKTCLDGKEIQWRSVQHDSTHTNDGDDVADQMSPQLSNIQPTIK